MNYTKLKNAIESSSYSLSDVFKKLNMARSGFYYSLEKRTLKVETFEKICGIIRVNPCDFFEVSYKTFENQQIAAENSPGYGNIDYKEKYLECLEKLNEANHKLIECREMLAEK